MIETPYHFYDILVSLRFFEYLITLKHEKLCKTIKALITKKFFKLIDFVQNINNVEKLKNLFYYLEKEFKLKLKKE